MTISRLISRPIKKKNTTINPSLTKVWRVRPLGNIQSIRLPGPRTTKAMSMLSTRW